MEHSAWTYTLSLSRNCGVSLPDWPALPSAVSRPTHSRRAVACASGYAQMASLACDWLQATDSATDDAGLSLGSTVPGPAGPVGTSYEYRFAEAVVRARFDGVRVDEATRRLRATGVQQPKWLGDCMATAQGRQLLYALAEEHRSCTTVGLAISFAWMLGHQDEVASLGAAAASKFDIFHGILRKRLDDVLHAPTQGSREAAIGELRRLCLGSPATYLFAQMLLCRLAGEPGGAPLRRVSHELEQAATVQHGVPLLRSIAPLLAATDADGAAIAAVNAFLTACERPGAQSHAATEAAALWSLYSPTVDRFEAPQQPPSGGAMPLPPLADPSGGPMDTDSPALPTLQPLRLPGVIHALLRVAFRPGMPVPPTADGPLPAAFELLALGCATPGERHATRAALVTAAQTCERAFHGTMPSQAAVDAFRQAPVSAAGALEWVRLELQDGEYYRRVEAVPSHPAYMALLKAIAEVAPQQHGALVDLMTAAMRTIGRTSPEKGDATLRLVPTLLRCGCVTPLLASVQSWAPEADRSTVRKFINAVFEVAAPPYSSAFAADMLALCVSSGMPNTGLVVSFVGEVSRASASRAFDPPLTAEARRNLEAMARPGS